MEEIRLILSRLFLSVIFACYIVVPILWIATLLHILHGIRHKDAQDEEDYYDRR